MFAECCSDQLCEELTYSQVCGLSARITAAACSVVLIWIGAALLMDVSLGVSLMGVAVVILGAQAVRSCFNLVPQWFWVIVGLLFLAWGFWEVYGLKLALARQPL
jgi:hypothetical protein